jgi:hypothetical protein
MSLEVLRRISRGRGAEAGSFGDHGLILQVALKLKEVTFRA